MTETYYVRKRGRITGPFSMADVCKMRERGLLSRTHELSLDQESWLAAYEFDNIFPTYSEVVDDSTNHGSVEPMTTNLGQDSAPNGPTTLTVSREWYYAQEDERLGPISEPALGMLITQQVITPETLVWTEGATNWEAAAGIVELSQYFGIHPPLAAKPNAGSITNATYCTGCGTSIHLTARQCPSCGAIQRTARRPTKRLLYIIIALFLGGTLGIHNFYAHRHTQAIIQLAIAVTLGWLGIGLLINAVWAFVECFVVTTDGDGQPFI